MWGKDVLVEIDPPLLDLEQGWRQKGILQLVASAAQQRVRRHPAAIGEDHCVRPKSSHRRLAQDGSRGDLLQQLRIAGREARPIEIEAWERHPTCPQTLHRHSGAVIGAQDQAAKDAIL
jgi:hypothetical protein